MPNGFNADITHDLRFVASDVNDVACVNCSACVCHQKDKLKEPCTRTMGVGHPFENKPERVIIAAIQEDPHAFDGMWYPTALSEDGLTVLAQNNPGGFEERNLFFITVSTEIKE